MVSGSRDGIPLDESLVRSGRRIVAGCEMSVIFGYDVHSKAKYTVDRSGMPAAIDIHDKSGMHARKIQRGIYEVTGKTLRISIAGVGRERPRDFSSNPGDGRTVVVWARIGPPVRT